MLGKIEKSKLQNLHTFNDIFISNAENNTNKTVVTQINDACEEIGSLSYSQLFFNSSKIAKQLLEHHKKGDRCLICLPASIEFIVAFMGCLLAGVIAVPTSIPRKNKTNSRFWSIFNDSKPNCLLTTSELKEQITDQISAQTTAEEIPSLVVVNVSEIESFTFNLPKGNQEDIAFLQYTSGSVSEPKGIMVSQKNLLHNSEIINLSYIHNEDLICVSWLPPFHDMGLIGCILQPLYVGGSIVISQPTDFIRNPVLWFKAISKYKAVTVGCPNFALDYCFEKINELDSDYNGPFIIESSILWLRAH